MILHKPFKDWLKKKKINLTPWQEAIANIVYTQGICGGKSFIIKVLFEFEADQERLI